MARQTPPDTNTALMETPPQALATYDAKDTRGKESFDSGDYEIPELRIAQKTSKVIEKGHAKFIKGLEFGDLYNSLTGENCAQGPVPFVIVRHMKNAAIFDKNQKVIERDVPLDDPRCNFVENPDGTSTKPIATVFHNYAILRTDTLELMMFRLKSTQMKSARQLNGRLKLLKGPIWSAVFEVRTTIETFPSGAAGVPIITHVGATPPDIAALAETAYEQTANMAEKVAAADEREATSEAVHPHDQDVPF